MEEEDSWAEETDERGKEYYSCGWSYKNTKCKCCLLSLWMIMLLLYFVFEIFPRVPSLSVSSIISVELPIFCGHVIGIAI